ncbi:MAG: alpha/beta hydrolase [Acidimicrobiia bacterium]|nr:alpha/beta hydrolase [Acidimicrobiia bacterium]
MASEKFQKFLTLLQNQPQAERVDHQKMRVMQDKVGGKFPEGVLGTPVDAGGVPAEWIDAPGAAQDAAVLYLHGGGYVAGSIDSHRNLTGNLAAAMGCRILALHYRLAPEHPHPAPVQDAVAAYRWMLGQGLSAERIMIAGDSAGGGLTMATLLALRDGGDPLPATATGISPWVDMEGKGDSMKTRADADPMINRDMLLQIADLFLGGADPTDPLAAPLQGELAGLPPLLIQVGDAEVLLDDSTRFAAKAEAAGVDVTLEVWPEMVHVWHASAGFVPEADQAIARIAEFSRPKLGL